ncbi:MAG: hypothetical protein H4O13_09785 [Xanthomonadales bacterium]|nr:hypothetical protein [Xanthomonadales bacterium]
MIRPVCLARLALRRLCTLENFALAFIVAATAAVAVGTAWLGWFVLSIPA